MVYDKLHDPSDPNVKILDELYERIEKVMKALDS